MVTLGAPHFPPPAGSPPCATRGALAFCDEQLPGALLASAPVRWPGVVGAAWTEVAADGVVVVEGARVRAAAPVATKPRPWPFVPPPRAPAPRAPAPPSPPRPSAKTDAVGAADARMRAVVARVASANRSGLGAHLAAAKKRRLAALRAGASADDLVASLEAFAAALARADGGEQAALVERDRVACASGLTREAAAATGDAVATGANGAATDRRALAESQARLYDARYSSSSAAEGHDRAGVEEVHTTVARETEAIASAIADVGDGTTVHLLDFGSGNGRCFAASRAAARARGKALAVTAYDVSSGALGAFRRALVDDPFIVSSIAWPSDKLVCVGVLLSTLGAGLQSLAGAPRLLAAIGRDGLIPPLARLGCAQPCLESHLHPSEPSACGAEFIRYGN